jgi:hypothetical protein
MVFGFSQFRTENRFTLFLELFGGRQEKTRASPASAGFPI